MLNKIQMLPVLAYLRLTQFVEDLKNDESGMEVVQVVLIILVGVILVAALMFLLRKQLAEWWNTITTTDVKKGTGDFKT